MKEFAIVLLFVFRITMALGLVYFAYSEVSKFIFLS